MGTFVDGRRRRPRARGVSLLWLAAGWAVFANACASTDPPSTCEPDCATEPPACDDGCPAIAVALCIDGRCEARGEDTTDVVVDVNIDRDLAGVAALLVAVVDARVATCAALSSVADAPGVLAGNRFEVAGGSFHPDLAGGLVPAGAIAVVVDAVDGEDLVVGHGCVAAVGAGGTLDVLVEVGP